MEVQKILYTEDLIRIRNIKSNELEMLKFTANELYKDVDLDKKTLSNLKRRLTLKEKEVNEVDNKMLDGQAGCDHLYITIGKTENIYISECAFCGKEKDELSEINAITYKRDIYSDGYNKEQRRERMKKLRNIIIDYLKRDENISKESLIEKLNNDIISNEEKNKRKEKSL